jgi:hypothetical protein
LSKGILASALTVILLAAIAAGCGGGDDTSGTSSGGDETAAGLSKAAFIKQGDAICADANEQGEKDAEEFAEDNDFQLEKATEAELEQAVADVLVPSLNRQAEEIGALGAPEGDEQQVEAIVASLEDAATAIEEDPSLAFEAEVLKKPSQLATNYGFKVCGEE